MTDLNIHVQLLITVFTGAFLYLLPFLKVFETKINLKVAPRETETVPITSQKFAANDTFEFDFKPIAFFEEGKKAAKGKGITLPVDYIMNLDVVIEPEEANSLNLPKNRQKTQNADAIIKKRLMTKRPPTLKKLID
jgi:hypothetical protein